LSTFDEDDLEEDDEALPDALLPDLAGLAGASLTLLRLTGGSPESEEGQRDGARA
jgi:hypothetical protein